MFPHSTCMLWNKKFNNWRVTADGANVTVSKTMKYRFFNKFTEEKFILLIFKCCKRKNMNEGYTKHI